MRMLRSLYAKIFGWFWLTLIVGASLVLVLTILTGSRPLGKRWMRVTQDMYAHSAVDFYETGGAPALERYLNTLKESSGIDASLLDEHQQDVLGKAVPANVGHVLERSLATGESTLWLGREWTAATPVISRQRHFVFVLEVHPLSGFVDGTFALPALSRLMLALVVAAIFCLVLTRHIVSPIRALQAASQRLAAGDLTTRVTPAIAPRDDELAETAQAFDRMADRIELLISKRQEMLADISHELRSPLTRVSVSLELLRRGEEDVIDQMQADIDRMNEMIQQILLLTRLDLQPDRVQFRSIALRPLLESLAQDAEFEAREEGKTVLIRTERSCSVQGDPNLLRSCIENILRNAVHYTDPNTSVEVDIGIRHLSSEPAYCEICVTDHGPGVAEESLPFLFDAFFRVSEARLLEDGGSGLGLSISRRIAELHQGKVVAENRRDTSGLIVRVLLPLA